MAYDDDYEVLPPPGSAVEAARQQTLEVIRRHLAFLPYRDADYQLGDHGKYPAFPPLFRATDTSDQVLVSTARLSNMALQKERVLVGEVMGDDKGPSVVRADSDDGRLNDDEKRARDLWRTYHIAEVATRLERHSVPYGDAFAEPLVWDGRLTFEVYAPWLTRVEYDGPLDSLSRATTYVPAAEGEGFVERKIEKGKVSVRGSEKTVPSQWVEAVPFIHLRGDWDGTTWYGTSALLAEIRWDRMIDARYAQESAIFVRCADPKLKAMGFAAGKDGEHIELSGNKIVFCPEDGMDVEWLTLPTQSVLTDIRESREEIAKRAAAQSPELRSSLPGANTSAQAWKARMMGLRTDVALRRASLWRAMQRMLAFAYSFEEGVEFGEALRWAGQFVARWPEPVQGDGSQKLLALSEATKSEEGKEPLLTGDEARAQGMEDGSLRPI